MQQAGVTTLVPPRRLFGIEAIRGCAATAVVLYHVSRHLNLAYGTPTLVRMFQFGHAGVDLFFVLSGFIIFFVHDSDLDRPARLRHYFGRRFTRVMPTYWTALALTILMGLAGDHALPSARWVAWSVALLPSVQPPILGVGWTLQFEVVFYVAFGALILSRRIGFGMFAAWLVLIGTLWFRRINAPLAAGTFGIPPQLCDAYILQFFMGMAAAYWLRRHGVGRPRAILRVGLVLFLAVAFGEDAGTIDGYAASSRLLYGIPAMLLIAGVAEAERSGGLSVGPALRRLGGASYSIYLFQFVFIGIVWKLWLATGLAARVPHLAAFPVLVSAALIGGLAMTEYVEKPMLRLVRGERARVATQAV